MDIKRARVFVVEDDKVMSVFILGKLRRLGILDLYAFADGAAALAEIVKLKPDLVLTDIHMQPVGGLEFVRELRTLSDARISQTPVIFLSVDSTHATVEEALPLGVSGFIVKPPTLEALNAKIERALRD